MLYRMFDKVLVLSEGYLIYSGRADGVMEYFGSLSYVPGFNFVNPADFLLDLANGMETFYSKLDKYLVCLHFVF